jgi:SNW domain-containing protein 1
LLSPLYCCFSAHDSEIQWGGIVFPTKFDISWVYPKLSRMHQPVPFGRPPPPPSSVTTVRYHGSTDHAIRIADKTSDPLDPSHFRNRKPIPLQQSDPAPILAAPPPKLTPEDERYWQVPTCVSNWKNPEGYVIPMDKRVGADARRFEQPGFSDKFANFSRALSTASTAIADSIAQKNMIQRQLAQKKQEQEEDRIREEARKLNEERKLLQKEKTRDDRKIERFLDDSRERREQIKRRNRDISARAALGIPITSQTVDDEFDPQLFGKSGGLGTGYGADDACEVYERPLFAEQKAYVPFAGDRARGPEVAPGERERAPVRFERGERQAPDTRAGVFYPGAGD